MYFLPGGGRHGATFAVGFRRWRSEWTASDAVRLPKSAALLTRPVSILLDSLLLRVEGLKVHQAACAPRSSRLPTRLVVGCLPLIRAVAADCLTNFLLSFFRFSAAATTIAIGCLCGVGLGGCSKGSTERASGPVPYEKRTELGTHPRVAIHHDFGMVSPGSRSVHRFALRNTGQCPWNVDSVVNTCRCTTTGLSSHVVHPGATLFIDVRYTAPIDDASDARTIEVHFRETDAPVFGLTVRALVRHPLYLTEKELNIETDQDRATATLVATNFTNERWDGLCASSGAPWLSVDIVPIEDNRERTSRQAWRVTLAAEICRLPTGNDSAVVRFGSKGARTVESEEAVVRARRRPAVRAVPRQLFLGRLSVGQHVRRRVILHLSEHSIREHGPVDPKQVAVSSHFAGPLSHRVDVLQNKVIALDLTLVAPELSTAVDERISAELGAGWPKVELPLTAVVEVSP